MIDNIELGERLKLEREKAELSQEETAKTLYMSRSAYQRVESGSRDVRLSELNRLSRIFPNATAGIKF